MFLVLGTFTAVILNNSPSAFACITFARRRATRDLTFTGYIHGEHPVGVADVNMPAAAVAIEFPPADDD